MLDREPFEDWRYRWSGEMFSTYEGKRGFWPRYDRKADTSSYTKFRWWNPWHYVRWALSAWWCRRHW